MPPTRKTKKQRTRRLQTFDEDDEDDEEARAALQAANLETLRVESLERLARIKASFTKMMRALARGGTASPAYFKHQAAISEELLYIRFAAKHIESMCDSVRGVVWEVRRHERNVMDLAVDKAGMPKTRFIKTFKGCEVDPEWVEREVEVRKPYVETLLRLAPDILGISKKSGKYSGLYWDSSCRSSKRLIRKCRWGKLRRGVLNVR
jgi:RNA polymerase primary sigma factor